MRYFCYQINPVTKIVKLPIYPNFETNFNSMDKKEAYQQIIYKLKEIEGTRLRLITQKPDTEDIELALLNQQVISLYQHLQNYKSGFFATAPAEAPQPKAKAINYIPVNEPAEAPEMKEETKPREPVVHEQKPQVELKRDTPDSQSRKERLKRLEAEAAKAEASRKKENPVPAPKGEMEDFTTIVEEKYQQADIREESARASGIKKEPEYTLKNMPVSELSLNEKLQSGTKPAESLNEKFQQTDSRKTLVDKMKLGPITDLKAAIPLNQKIAFTNQLFGGDDKEFKKALTFLNNCRNFSEAKIYLQSEVAKIHNWDENNPMVEEFTELVYRKFL
jgi:hypothetical protein